MKRKSADLLGDLHQLKDQGSIMPVKFTYSRVQVAAPIERVRSHQDFVQPADPLNIHRNTGYNAGHIRSILALDVFGPNHSIAVEEKRR